MDLLREIDKLLTEAQRQSDDLNDQRDHGRVDGLEEARELAVAYIKHRQEADARVRALEAENQRMRENARLKNRAAYLSAINACMARLQGQTDIKAVFPALHEMRDRAVELHNAALSPAREIAEEEGR